MKLPQLTLRELFLLAALAAMGSPANAQRPELSEEQLVANAHEISLEHCLKIFSYSTARVFCYAGSDEKFDYVYLQRLSLSDEVTLYRFKLPRGQAILKKRFPLRSEKPYNLTWATFPPEWRRPVKAEDPPQEAAVK